MSAAIETTECVVIGGGGHAKVLISVLLKSGYDVIGYTDRKDNGAVLGVPRLGTDDALASVLDRVPGCAAAIGLGKIEVASPRLTILRRLEELGFALPSIVSRDAVCNLEVELGAGTMLFDGVVVNSGTRTGEACILNTNCTVEHDCVLGADVHIAPGATLSGGVRVGDGCMIGAGASVIQGVRIVAGCLVGAGSSVVHDLEEPGVYVGNPARRLR